MDKLKAYIEGKLSPSQEKEVQDWIAQQGDNPEFLQRMQELLGSQEEIQDNQVADNAFKEVSGKLGIGQGNDGRKSHPASVVLRWCAAVAACLLLPFIGITGYKALDHSDDVNWIERKVPVGQVENLTLADGTHLLLNSGSRVTYPERFSGKERKIFVDGEVLAEVAKDPRHPFIIRSGEVGIKVLGTRFDFKSYDNTECVEVLLLEGSVRFDATHDGKSNDLTMKPGDMIQYNRSSGEISMKNFNKDSFRSFGDGRAIHFFSIPLSDITNDLERIFGTKIVILDENLAQKKYFAIFTNNESLDQILSALSSKSEMKIVHKDGVIYLTSL
jgi:transmembrane sensor